MIDQAQFPYPDGQEMDNGLSARALLLSIRRHLGVVLVLSLALCAGGTVIGLGLPPRVQAEATLVIHPRPLRVSDVQEVLGNPLPDVLVIRSEVDVLQSRSVIEPVVRSLALWQLPEFQASALPAGWTWEALERRLRGMWDTIVGRPEDDIRDPPLIPRDLSSTVAQAEIDEAVEKYTRYLNVQTDSRSMTIRVSYRAWTPARAAAVVNAHLDSYQQVQVQAKAAAARTANSWLTNQVTELRNQLQTAENAVSRYREEHRLTGAAKNTGVLSQQLASLNSQLIAAQADLAESEERAARIGARSSAKGGADSVPEVVASGTIQLLRGQEAELVQREANLAAHHGDSYPELQKLRSSLRDLRGQINREIGRSQSAALALVERSRARERSIQQAVLELTRQINSADAALQQLEGNAESIRTVLRGFEKRVAETAADPAFINSNSTVVSRANPSAAWSSSKTPMLAGAGGFVGLTLGCLLALLLEHRDKTFRTSTQVQEQVSPRTVGVTPRIACRRQKSPADIILDGNRSAFAEAFRLSWANIQFTIEGPARDSSNRTGLGRALGITSAATGEGKSTHALAFARTAALAGERVVLVDADLRRSGVSRLLNHNARFTLRDFLLGRCTASDIIMSEERSGIYFVPSAPCETLWTSHDLQRFAGLINYLKARFALIIIDMPPILGLAETIRLTVVADSMALIIRWGRTERQRVQYALDALRTAGATTSAVILNDVNLKAQQRRGYRDRTVVYTDEGLYRAEPGDREPPFLPPLASAPNASSTNPEAEAPQAARPNQDPDIRRKRTDAAETPVNASTGAKSDIQRLYERYPGK
jgi:succinoglycan biosynthesis transport protein ExoP